MVMVIAREPGVGPGDVAVGVVLQFEGGCLGVRLCFEEGAPGLCALGERGGEKGGERVREEGVHFGGVQYWLVGRTGMGGALLSLVAEGKWEGWTHREGVVEDEYDYPVRVVGDVYVRGVVERYARSHKYLVSGEKGVEDAEEGQFVLVLRKTNLCDFSANNQRNAA
jgi:hypothetical protein